MSPSVSVRLLLTQSDERLVGFARAGHERAFEALVRRYRRQLHGYCRRLLLSDERAEDTLQQALLQAWLALRDGAEVQDVRAWLYRIVHNAAVNALRVSGYDYSTLSESLSGAGAPQADLDRRIAVREALAGLAALPQMQREALLRTAVEGRTHRQVASDLGLSEPALRGLVYRARATLRAAAGAIVPPPLLGWALDAGARGTPAVERLAELGSGGGSAGIAGLLVKGGAVAVTAGALAGGIVAAHAHRVAAHPAGAASLRPGRPHNRAAAPSSASWAPASDAARADGVVSTASAGGAGSRSKRLPVHAGTPSAAARSPTRRGSASTGRDRSSGGPRSHAGDGSRGSGPSDAGSGESVEGATVGHGDGGSGSGGQSGGSGADAKDGESSSPGATVGDSSGSSKDSSGDSADHASGDSGGASGTTSGGTELRSGDKRSGLTTGANTSSKDEQSPLEGVSKQD
jgi:RNA polymerase sigma factor (sigma-70 family)